MNLRLVAAQQHLDDIEAVVDVRVIEHPQPGQRAAGDQLLLGEIDGLDGRSEIHAAPRLHLDEDERVAAPIAAHEIDLAATGRAEIAVENLVALPAEMALREAFAAASEPVAQIAGLSPQPAARAPQVRKTADESGKGHVRGA